MSRRTRLFVILASTPLVVFVMVGGLLGAVVAPAPQQGVVPLKVFDDVLRLIFGAYVEPPNVDKVMDGAMRGLADGLDPVTSYLSPEEVRTYDARTPLPTADVGITVSRRFWLRVVGVRDGSPAQRAGIRSGDFIRAINDSATRDVSAYAGQRMLAGPAGSKVTLLMLRDNAADPHPVELVREEAGSVRATGRRLPGGEAYVRVVSFGQGAVAAIQSAVQSTGPAAAPGLILDLRDTADGRPEDGIAAARLFVAKGTLATREGQDLADAPMAGTSRGTITSRKVTGPAGTAGRTIDTEVISAGPGDGALSMPLVVIVSRGTGQAAEILAAALAGNKRGTLVGEPTAGLAATQSLLRLPEGHGLLMTTIRYLQADGRPIHSNYNETRGLRPEVPVEVPSVSFDQPAPANDVLLAAAVEALKKARS
jgi:carboxyl-terminal processing protease